MNIRCIVFDLDGVIFQGSLDMMRQILKLRYPELDLEVLNEFFRDHMRDCIMNKKDTCETMAPYLKRAGWRGSAMDYIRFWHATDHCPDFEMLDLVDELRNSGIICVTGTDQEKYRWQYIKETMQLGEHFNHMIAGCDLDAHKPTHKFFYGLFEKLLGNYPDLEKQEVLFVDDSKNSVAGALDFGFLAHRFTNREKLIEFLGIEA